MDAHACVSFLLIRNGKVLLERRSLEKPSDPGVIAIPGGHIEDGETREDALVREMKEELNITPVSYGYLCTLYHPTSELQLVHYYVVVSWSGELSALEAEEVFWSPLPGPEIEIDADRTAISEYLRLKATIPGLV